MSIPCFYHPDLATQKLSAEAARHAASSLRLKVGDQIMLLDGNGATQLAELTYIKGPTVLYRGVGPVEHRGRAGARVCLWAGQLRHPDRMEWLVEKCQELGLERLVIFKGDYSQKTHLRVQRIESLAIAAMQQSQNPYLMQIQYVEDIQTLLSQEGKMSLVFGYKGPIVSSVSLRDVVSTMSGLADAPLVHGVVGPEGDFSERELRLLKQAGGNAVLLGPSRLRAETAGVALASYLRLWLDRD